MDQQLTLFFEALKHGDREAVLRMINMDPALVRARDQGGLSAVLTAAYHQEPELAQLLVDRGAPLDIFEAAAVGEVERVQEVLDTDTLSCSAFSPDGFQPLGLASFFGQERVAALLLLRGAEVNTPSRNPLAVRPIHSAAAGGHVEIVRLLLAHGADPDVRQSGGFTPLHSAAQNGQVEMIEMLISHGVDVSATSDEGKSPLDYARENGHTAAADLLESYR